MSVQTNRSVSLEVAHKTVYSQASSIVSRANDAASQFGERKLRSADEQASSRRRTLHETLDVEAIPAFETDHALARHAKEHPRLAH